MGSNGDEGYRTIRDSASKTPISPEETKNGTQDGTPKGENTPLDPDLAFIHDRWPRLPEHIKQSILALVRSLPPRQ